MNTLSLLELLASTTWELLRNASVSGIQLREDAITAFNLLALATAKDASLIEIEDMSRTEATTGCDFEMWLQRKDRKWLRLAVQAKKVDPKSGNYKQIRHKVGQALQIDILEDYASANNALASYCLYNYSSSAISTRCVGTTDQSQLGCTIVNSRQVRTALSRRGDSNFTNMHTKFGAVPWRCLLTCFSIRLPSASYDGIELSRFLYDKLPGAFEARRQDRLSVVSADNITVFASGRTPERVIILGDNCEG